MADLTTLRTSTPTPNGERIVLRTRTDKRGQEWLVQLFTGKDYYVTIIYSEASFGAKALSAATSTYHNRCRLLGVLPQI